MRCWLSALALMAMSCTTTVERPATKQHVKKVQVTRHRFAPTHIVGRPVPNRTTQAKQGMPDPLGGLSAAALYELASRAQEEQQWTKSLSIWNRLLAEYPSAVQRVFALLGSASSLQRLGRCGEALPRFEEAVDMLDPEDDAEDYVDARFSMGSCYAEKRKYDEVIDLFTALLDNFAMPTEMRIASLVSLGVGLFMNGELKDARRRFQAGIDEHNLKKQSEYLDDRYYMGQAHFYLGELHRTDFRKVDLAAAKTSEAMAELLDDKCDHLLDAQMSYVRAIRTRHFGWASAAAHQVGTMYEGLYVHMQDLPRPEDLTELQGLEYKRELTKKVAVLLRKAIKMWTSALEFAARTGTDNIWVRETKKKLARVEKLYFDEYLDPRIEKELDEASDREAEAEQLAAQSVADSDVSKERAEDTAN
jgi:tetratricopeptide (TPR) repeat protein